ncbi:MAG: hypothetical protein GX799_11560 [Crenarchaeota archaeon]|nr:hypothetical protein [Thermoproteota archaeon]
MTTFSRTTHKHYTEFGRICKCADIPGSKPKWDWKVTSLNECRFILEHITPYITSERKLKGAQFLLTFRSRKYGSRHTTKEHEMPCLSV